MRGTFYDFKSYVRLHDGYGKPDVDFQSMYKLFPDFEFIADRNFGKYENYGEAYERKNYCMKVVAPNGAHCYMIYYRYTDANENLAYVS